MSDHKIWKWRKQPFGTANNKRVDAWIARSLLEKLLGASAWIADLKHNLKINWTLYQGFDNIPRKQKAFTNFVELSTNFFGTFCLCGRSISFFFSRWRTPWRYGMTESQVLNWRCFFLCPFCLPEIWGLKRCGRLSEQQTPRKKKPMGQESLISNPKRSLKQRRHLSMGPAWADKSGCTVPHPTIWCAAFKSAGQSQSVARQDLPFC